MELYPHVVRGGSFANGADRLRSASRGQSEASWKEADPQSPKSNWWFPFTPIIGFRIVRPAVEPTKEVIEEYYRVEPIEEY